MAIAGRIIVLVAATWVIMAAAEPKPSPAPQSLETVAKPLGGIATTLRAQAGRSDPNKPCPEGKDDRASDLCAQWKAADAAKESADWTRRTFILVFIGTVIGFATLAAAVKAAQFAGKAAIETEKSAIAAMAAVSETREANSIARETMTAENRAWIDATAHSPQSWQSLPDEYYFSFKVRVHNVGHSLARQLHCSATLFQAADMLDGTEKAVNEFADRQRGELAQFATSNVFPNKHRDMSIDVVIPKTKFATEKELYVNLCVCAQYRTIFDGIDDELRQTCVVYSLRINNANGRATEPLTPNWTYGAGQVVFAHPFKDAGSVS